MEDKLEKYNKLVSQGYKTLNEILEENKDDCSPAFSSSIKDFTDKVMTIFYILVLCYNIACYDIDVKHMKTKQSSNKNSDSCAFKEALHIIT